MTQKISRQPMLAAALVVACGVSRVACAETIPAASCDQETIQRAVTKANVGDVIDVPAGTCRWGSFEIAKGIHLRGAGSEATKIVMEGTFGLTKDSRHSIELSGFTFTLDRRSSSRIFYVGGPWEGEPPLIHDNVFDIRDALEDDSAGILQYETNGGLIYRNTFGGNLDDSGIQHKLRPETDSWAVADTMGTRDTDGKRNLYVEDNVFEGMANQATDFDDGARVVFRYNILRSSSFNSHGLATSPVGVRHYEIYNNFFTYPDTNINQNWHIWLRGGTGVIFGNGFDDIKGRMWGNKTELHVSVRAAQDGGVNGCCTAWPCMHQIGQNYDGSKQYLDPVYLWSNSGTLATTTKGWEEVCGNDIDDFLQNGRDFVFSPVPKRGYTPYPYPHPLRDAATRRHAPSIGVLNP